MVGLGFSNGGVDGYFPRIDPLFQDWPYSFKHSLRIGQIPGSVRDLSNTRQQLRVIPQVLDRENTSSSVSGCTNMRL